MIDWKNARQTSLLKWHAIRDAVGEASPAELLTVANEMCDMCVKAKEEQLVQGSGTRCDHCLYLQQFGGCQEVTTRLNDRIVARDWTAVRELTGEVIRRLETLRIPAVE